jgi:peptidoglycan/xylan/chitin deacetylase (PgdA/CDA1 family)
MFKKIMAANHSVGNHTYNHLKGWITTNDTYVENTLLCEREMSKVAAARGHFPNFPLFRPPYGKIKRKQAKALHKKGFKIIMYRTIAYDWDEKTTPEQCLVNVIKKTRNGDLIVFHDSVKAYKNMKYALPRMIDHFLEKGYRFEKL